MSEPGVLASPFKVAFWAVSEKKPQLSFLLCTIETIGVSSVGGWTPMVTPGLALPTWKQGSQRRHPAGPISHRFDGPVGVCPALRLGRDGQPWKVSSIFQSVVSVLR